MLEGRWYLGGGLSEEGIIIEGMGGGGGGQDVWEEGRGEGGGDKMCGKGGQRGGVPSEEGVGRGGGGGGGKGEEYMCPLQW